MKKLRTFSMLLLILSVLGAVRPAQSQMPPHKPGTICATPRFWCWAQPPGPPGSPCFCPSPQGAVQGRLR